MFNDLNPKAVANDELLGIINPSTREWKDRLSCIYEIHILAQNRAHIPESPRDVCEQYFCFAAIWNFGSACFQDQLLDWRNEFSKSWMSKISASWNCLQLLFFINSATKEFLMVWFGRKIWNMNPDISLQSTLVPITDTTRLRYFMDKLVDKQQENGASSHNNSTISW